MQGRADYTDDNKVALCNKYLCKDCEVKNDHDCDQAWNYMANDLEECQIYAEGEK